MSFENICLDCTIEEEECAGINKCGFLEDVLTQMENGLEPRYQKKGFARIKAALNLNWRNAIKEPIDSIKWIIALYLDEDPYYCWADLVMWAEKLSGYGFFEGLRDRKEFMASNCGYCGKCETFVITKLKEDD